ncbi:MAG: hypothetical protein BRD29_02330, partial [Bacteroidetes bacterium QH_2_67_10]
NSVATDDPTGDEHVLYGINAAAGGFSGEVDEEVTTELKKTWGPLAYLVGAARAVPDLHEYDTHVSFDDEAPEAIDALNVIVANGRTIGGGKRVAPGANPCDGLLDVVIVKWGRMVDFATVGARLVAGTWLQSPYVRHHRVRKVRVASDPGMWFNVDGELQTKEPLTFEVLPGALPVVVGPARLSGRTGAVAGGWGIGDGGWRMVFQQQRACWLKTIYHPPTYQRRTPSLHGTTDPRAACRRASVAVPAGLLQHRSR